MKNCSVKMKITLLLTMLMTTMAVFLLVFMLIISNAVATQTARRQLTDTLRYNLSYVEALDKKATIQEGFSYSHNGVTTLIYGQNKALIAGQIPVAFQVDVPFENGMIRSVDSKDATYLVLDLWLAENWDSGIWLRGLMEAPNNEALTKNLLTVALIALPIFILLSALGSYHIARRSFRPLEHITATAEAINEAKDLSGRIGLPPGKDEFSRLAENFDKMFERLERSFEAEKQFTADASHELRTPISIIKGACEYAQKYDETPEEHAETISMIHRQADKMAALVSQLLSMTRMEQGIENIAMKPIELSQFLNHLCEEQCWDKNQIVIHAPESCVVQGNEELLGRLIQNLVENAVKYSSKQAKIEMNLEKTDSEVHLSVKDHGIGISEEEQQKIWQRFYQVDASRSGEEGSGLGLAMVKQIAKIHGGRMLLESTLGKGSVFTLCIPKEKVFES